MRAVLATAAAALFLGTAGYGLSRAALTDASSTNTPSIELLVFEHPDCTYCPVFRSRVAEQYRHSPQAAEAPLRFVDVTSTDADRIALKAPISMVPTTVVMKNGREVDRVAGYWSPDNFFKMVTLIVRSVE